MTKKVLVINSCGKAKQNSFDNQPTCTDLNSSKKRKKIKEKYQNKTIAARYLYTGSQAKMVSQAINILRNIGFNVDYYIISAGFGLINEKEKVPPYDCTFSDKSKSEVLKMSKNLKIEKAITNLPKNYDLIYLALGRKYLQTFDLQILENKGTKIVHFSRDFNKNGPYVAVNDTKILGKSDEISTFYHKPGGLVSTKGGILLNYAESIKRETYVEFNKWWNDALSELGTINSLSMTSGSINKPQKNKDSIPNFDPTQRRKDIMPSPKADKLAKELASKLSDEKIKLLWKLSSELNPPQQRKDKETYGDWVEPFKDYEEDLKMFSEFFEDSIRKIQNKTASNKTEARKTISNAVRERQKKLLPEENYYFCNPVKVSLIDTALKYLNSPEIHDEEMKKRKRSKKSTKKSKNNEPIDFTIEVNEIKDEYISGYINNPNDFPLQNMVIELIDIEDQKIGISNALGSMFSTGQEKVFVKFVKAAMDANIHKTKFKLEFSSFHDLQSGFRFKVQIDNPITKEVETKVIEHSV